MRVCAFTFSHFYKHMHWQNPNKVKAHWKLPARKKIEIFKKNCYVVMFYMAKRLSFLESMSDMFSILIPKYVLAI